MRSLLVVTLLVSSISSYGQLYRPYTTPNRWAVTGEVGGISPILSLNAEYIPAQFRTHFIVMRGGTGQLFTRYSYCTLPHGLTWDVLLNGKTKGCPPVSPKRSFFAEIGIGGVYLVGATEDVKYRWSPILGVRRYFSYNVRANGFWKAQLTPIVAGKLVPWGGLGIGLIID